MGEVARLRSSLNGESKDHVECKGWPVEGASNFLGDQMGTLSFLFEDTCIQKSTVWPEPCVSKFWNALMTYSSRIHHLSTEKDIALSPTVSLSFLFANENFKWWCPKSSFYSTIRNFALMFWSISRGAWMVNRVCKSLTSLRCVIIQKCLIWSDFVIFLVLLGIYYVFLFWR